MTTASPEHTGELVLYRTEDGTVAVDVRLDRDTVWLSQRQMAELFDKNTDTVGLHIRNIFKERELEPEGTTEESSVVQTEGGRTVRRTVRFYNLDVIISVGYRVKSKRGTQFRQCAGGVLRGWPKDKTSSRKAAKTQRRAEGSSMGRADGLGPRGLPDTMAPGFRLSLCAFASLRETPFAVALPWGFPA